jgi:superoxide dismutase, Fe-Mn family
MSFVLPPLGFEYNALEPYIDTSTMEIHYMHYYSQYLEKFNEAIINTDLETKTPTQIFSEISKYPESVKNYGGGYFNHTLFWKILAPASSGLTDTPLADAITKYFGTIIQMKDTFLRESVSHFGSGWTWLVKRVDGELLVTTTMNQDNPLMDTNPIQGSPILCLDLWEHAYYLKYQDQREDYIRAFWHLVNWEQVARLYNNEF